MNKTSKILVIATITATIIILIVLAIYNIFISRHHSAPSDITSDITVSQSQPAEDTSENKTNANTSDNGMGKNTSKELTLEELDYIHYETRLAAAKPYENQIMDLYQADYNRNDRVVGHIRIDGTDIDCPVLQKLEDYEFYLTHDIDDNESKQGCIILDPDSEIGIGTKLDGYLDEYEPSTNQLVHGHNMRAGTMFGTLPAYADEAYGLSHKYIYFDSLYEQRTYELVLAFYSKIYPVDSDDFKYYNFNQADTEEEFNEWYSNICNLALYHTGLDVEYGDEMITLSTCSYHTKDGRFAVVGKRID